MSVTFGLEPFGKIIPELPALSMDHFNEVAADKSFPPVIDFNWYLDMEKLNILKTFSARSNGILVGYLLYFLTKSRHYEMMEAFADTVYLRPEYRSGSGLRSNGEAFFGFAEGALRRMVSPGSRLRIHNKMKAMFAEDRGGIRKMMEKMDYNHTDDMYTKVIIA